MKRGIVTLTLIMVILFSTVVGVQFAKLAKANPDSVIKYLIGISIESPENKTYNTTKITLNIYAYTQMGPDFTPLIDVRYSVDGEPFVYFADPVGTNVANESVVLDLPEGSHTIIAKARTLNVQAGLDREVCTNVTFTIQSANAQFLGSVYIADDGSVVGTNSIKRNGNVYTLSGNISGGIQVQRSNIVIDGVGYTVQGNGAGRGLDLSNSVGEDPSRSIITNVTLENLRIVGFGFGVETNGGGNHTFIGNYFADCVEGIDLGASSYNNITYCTFVDSTLSMVYQANYNVVAKNNFLNSSVQVWLSGYETIDGNYWSDYNGTDANGDGIGDTPYGHPSAIIDNHPLMNPVSIPKPEFNDGTGESEPFPTLSVVAVTVTLWLWLQ